MNRVELKARIDEIASLLSELEWEYSACLSALAALDNAQPSSGLTIEPCPVLPDSTARTFLTMVNTDGSRKTVFLWGEKRDENASGATSLVGGGASGAEAGR